MGVGGRPNGWDRKRGEKPPSAGPLRPPGAPGGKAAFPSPLVAVPPSGALPPRPAAGGGWGPWELDPGLTGIRSLSSLPA